MRYRILGPIEVEAEGRLVELGGAKQRAVLALLLLRANEVVSSDRLLEEVWQGRPPETAPTALQVYVSQLRKLLGRETIVTRAPGYAIQVPEGDLDSNQFASLVAAARNQVPAEAAEQLQQALALWRGPPLADLDESFAQPERARLEEQRQSALEQRIDADLALGRASELVPELEGLVAAHPLRERLRGQLMVALYRSGRQADALDVYRSGRRLLQTELGLEPSEELRQLERAILEQDPSLATPSAGGRSRSDVPTGTVTFLFTDIEGSTELVQELGDGYGQVLEEHHRRVHMALSRHGGEEVAIQGDAFFFAFRRARDAVRGAVEAQRAVAAGTWPRDVQVRVRIGIHTGEPGLTETGYHGLDVVRAARISGSAYGGQILVSSATRDLVGATLTDVSFKDIGEHRLKDLEQPQHLHQVVAPGLQEEFPPPQTAAAARVMTIGGREQELAVAAQAALGAEERRMRLLRRSRVAALVGVVVLGGVVSGVLLAVTGGSSVVTVEPNSVAVIDPETSEVTDDVPVGLRPVAVAVGEGAVWVANADDGTVQRIDPETMEVVATIGIGGEVSDLAVGFGSVWIAGGNDETLTRIDPGQNAVEARLTFGPLDPLDPQPMFVVATGAGAVWVTRGNRVLRVDPRSHAVTATIPADQPTAIAVGAGSVWVTGFSERIVRIEPTSGIVTATIATPAPAWAPVADPQALWAVIGIGGGEIWRFVPDTGSPSGTVRTREGPIDLALDGETLWAANLGTRSVSRIDVADGEIIETVPIDQPPTGLAVGESAVWVTVESPAS